MRADGVTLPRVKYWTAWNEPNLPLGLVPQWRRVAGHWVIQSARDYARICNAVVTGVHGTLIPGELVACGDTAPRGNNAPTSSRPTTSPLAFLRAMKQAGATGFDAYAHHPYPSGPSESPTMRPKASTAVTFGNLGDLTTQVTKLYGRKPIWLDEYGYQTDPPDKGLGVSPAKQAQYLTQAVALARRNPRVTMLLWFLVRDEPQLSGWQSGPRDAHRRAQAGLRRVRPRRLRRLGRARAAPSARAGGSRLRPRSPSARRRAHPPRSPRRGAQAGSA